MTVIWKSFVSLSPIGLQSSLQFEWKQFSNQEIQLFGTFRAFHRFEFRDNFGKNFLLHSFTVCPHSYPILHHFECGRRAERVLWVVRRRTTVAGHAVADENANETELANCCQWSSICFMLQMWRKSVPQLCIFAFGLCEESVKQSDK